MNIDQIKKTLQDKFNSPRMNGEKRHIVFWYDVQGDFIEDVDRLDLSNVKILKLEKNNNFYAKYLLEKVDTHSNYLVYSSFPKPEDKHNWLLDTELYSYFFTADKITIIMNSLGIEDGPLRQCFLDNEKFFRSAERYNKFEKLGIGTYTEETINLGILAVLTKQKTTDIEEILRELFIEGLDEAKNPLWKEIQKFEMEEFFWAIIEHEYGYIGIEKTLKNLFIFMVITAMANGLKAELPKAWGNYISKRPSNCIVFLDHFMSHTKYANDYKSLSDIIEKDLNFRELLLNWDVDDYLELDFFRVIDKQIILTIINGILNGQPEYDKYLKVIGDRRLTHFYGEFENIYETVYWAVKMFHFQQKYALGIPSIDARGFFTAYTKDFYKMDQYYRRFCLEAAKETGTDILKPLSEKVENLYTNWFLQELSVKWSDTVFDELAENWMINGIHQQKNFYSDFIHEALSSNKKAFVIISDGLRYEAGEELMDRLNVEFKGSTRILFMQSSLPSDTNVGMASLLPNNKLELKGDSVSVDDLHTDGLLNREQVLKKKRTVSNEEIPSKVVKLNDILTMGREGIRDTFRGQDVVYIYHDLIDAMGEKPQTEDKVFAAVSQTLDEIQACIRNITKNLTEANIYITADHGFIYQRRPLEESDKTPKGGAVPLMSNSRYMILDGFQDIQGTLTINLKDIFAHAGSGNKDNSLYAIVPRGNNRYKIQGTSKKYVHGGASLQEIVVPVIHYQMNRHSDLTKEVKKVPVKLTSTNRKITNSIFTLNFFQTEPIEGKTIPRSLKVYFEDGNGYKISDDNAILADKTSDKPNERTFKLSFSLKNKKYNRSENYYLVMEDPDEAVNRIYEKIIFSINLGIVNEFDF